jgi:hypothetical protein
VGSLRFYVVICTGGYSISIFLYFFWCCVRAMGILYRL